MNETRPVLIVGAGPTGMTAAMELSRFGVPIRIVDKLMEPSTTSRALAVQARTLELFQQRGLAEEMLRLGSQGNAAAIHGDGKLLGKISLAGIESRYNFILLLSQAETERLLREQLARQGITIERGMEMVAFDQPESSTSPGQSGGIKAVLRGQNGSLEELEVSYLISAEGAHSTVRHTLNLDFKGRSLDANYALADLHLDGDIPDDELSIFLSQHGFLAVFPMGNRHFRFIATDPEKHGKDAADPTLDELQQIFDEVAHIPARLRDMTWSSRFRINSRMLQTLQESRVFFGGDAAHIHSPAGGQGMNTGIQDMIDLSWKLALVWQGKAAPDLLATYAEDRLPVIRSVVSKTEKATDAFSSDSAIAHALITHIAPLLLKEQFVQHIGAGLISEVAANYRASSLSKTEHAHGLLRAGDRVPDLEVLTWDKDASEDAAPRALRLYGLFDPSLFTLLVTQGAAEAGPLEIDGNTLTPWKGLVQICFVRAADSPSASKERFEKCFGTASGLFLVRPDSYLGFAGSEKDWPAMTQWLTRWLPPPIR